MRNLTFVCSLISIFFFGSCSNNTCERGIPYISNGRIFFDNFSFRSEGRTIIQCEENVSGAGTIENNNIKFSFLDQVGMSKSCFELMHIQEGEMIGGMIVTKKDTILDFLIVESLYKSSGKDIAAINIAALDKIPEVQTMYNKGYVVTLFTEVYSKQEQMRVAEFFSSLVIE